jgi:hypothetical protein
MNDDGGFGDFSDADAATEEATRPPLTLCRP